MYVLFNDINVAVAIKYAKQGKRVILSSRNINKLQEVQQEIINYTNKDKSNYPIVCVDIERNEEFIDKVNVNNLFTCNN